VSQLRGGIIAVVGAVMGVYVLAAASSASVAHAQPTPQSFIAVLTADEEVPRCTAATHAARGVAVFHVLDQASGLVSYRLVANNLPGTISAAHIHLAPVGVPGPVVQPLPLIAGAENGVIGAGTFTNPALLAQLQADPGAFYVNVHSTVCGPGVIRGQLRAPGA
jgi:hypothetical protein